MALTTSDIICIYEGAADSSAQQFRDPNMEVNIMATDADDYQGSLFLSDSSGNVTGAQTFTLTSTELIAQEAGFAAAYATVKAAYQKAIKARLDAIPANSGKTITYS